MTSTCKKSEPTPEASLSAEMAISRGLLNPSRCAGNKSKGAPARPACPGLPWGVPWGLAFETWDPCNLSQMETSPHPC
jgi:hypothetical protein